ncbi:Glycosyl transferase, group 2 family protein [Marinobacter nitratireducens]|uniref:Glycosyl transferase, group 2 family protein n=1 Tax=Marinobacter nitratireducens TaxID=1137280 RepID=A0A072N3Y8_9GAMM|nr:glycosyltransferase [Marinobacter nitratireducens]KEF32226.1 Glycosyl transferase, group 2 family protein [Marinobacter nitratireducens]
MIEVLFWVALLGSVYSYFLYPFALSLIPTRVSQMRQADGYQPRISLIVTAHNEEGRIVKKLENCLAIDYPNLEIIIASDASTDRTDDIVKGYSQKGVTLARADERKGKEYAQLQAIKAAKGDILVFSDVATDIPTDALQKMVFYFRDDSVGAVSSEDRFITRDGGIAGEGAYVKYEMWLRSLESKRAGLVGLSGSFFAARKEVCQQWDIAAPSDFNTALNCASQKLVAVSAPDVLGYYQDVADSKKEYERKLRTIIRGLTAIERHPEVMNPVRYGWFSFQVLSHKLMRWAVPWFLLLLIVTSVPMADEGGLYSLALFGQLIFYLCVFLAYARPSLRDNKFLKIPFFFIQVNLAIAHATIRFLSGTRMTVWTPSKR